MKRALTEEVADVRDSSEQNWGIPAHYTPAQVVANTTMQEFVTADFYRNHAQAHEGAGARARSRQLLARTRRGTRCSTKSARRSASSNDPEALPMVIEALKEFGMPGAYLLDDYDDAPSGDGSRQRSRRSPRRRRAFVRLFAKMERILGRAAAMRVFTEGNYLSDGRDDPSKKKMRPEMITRLITRKLA